MKSLKNILGEKKDERSVTPDKKLIEKVFFKVLKGILPNITLSDIGDFRLKDRIIYLRTSHPAIAGEIWKKKENLKKKINSLLEEEYIDKIIAK